MCYLFNRCIHNVHITCLYIEYIRSKVKLSLYLTKYHTMKMYWRSRGTTPCILNLGTRLRTVISFNPQLLYPEERVSNTHWTRGWVGTRSALDTVGKENPCP